jgi:formylglycine-generating enzyme required for sulfatase activity
VAAYIQIESPKFVIQATTRSPLIWLLDVEVTVKYHRGLVGLSLCLVMFLAGCDDEITPPTDPQDQEEDYFEYTSDTVILDEATLALLESYDENGTFTFIQSTPDLDALVPGNVLLGEPGDVTQFGFLRLIDSMDTAGEQIIIMTSQATLEDAFAELEVHIVKQLTIDDIEGEPRLMEGVSLCRDRSCEDGFKLDIDDKVIYGDLKANGSICVTPSFELFIDIDWLCQLSVVNFKNTTTVTSELEVSVETEADIDEQEITLGEFTMKPVVIFGIVVVPKLTLTLGGEVSSEVTVSTSVTQTATLITGLEYSDGEWTDYCDYSSDFDYEEVSPSLDLTIEGFVGPQLDLKLYGVAGPYVNFRAYLEHKVETEENPWWSISAGGKVGGGINISVLGKEIDNYEVPEITAYSSILAQADTTTLIPDFSANFTEGDAPLTVQFTDLTTPEDSTKTWLWDFGDETDTETDQHPEHTFAEPGNYTITLTTSIDEVRTFEEIKASYISVLPPPGTGTIEIDPEPNSLNAPWSITGPDEYQASGTGDQILSELSTGEYTLTWGEVAGWITPTSPAQMLLADGLITFGGTYTEEQGQPEGFVLIPAGNFIMGSPEEEIGHIPTEVQHSVTLTTPFYMFSTEITNQQFVELAQWAYDQDPPLLTTTAHYLVDAMDGSTAPLLDILDSDSVISFNDGTFSVDMGMENHPVQFVSWAGAASYCDWLSLQTGLQRAYDHSTWLCNNNYPYAAVGYRLPTEAEREYACRAGSITAFANGEITSMYGNDPVLNEIGWYGQNSNGVLQPVGQLIPNGWGLYDMHGNLTEWCNDWDGDYAGGAEIDPVGSPPGSNVRICRGGYWSNPPLCCRSAYRQGGAPNHMYPSTGFRPVRSVH